MYSKVIVRFDLQSHKYRSDKMALKSMFDLCCEIWGHVGDTGSNLGILKLLLARGDLTACKALSRGVAEPLNTLRQLALHRWCLGMQNRARLHETCTILVYSCVNFLGNRTCHCMRWSHTSSYTVLVMQWMEKFLTLLLQGVLLGSLLSSCSWVCFKERWRPGLTRFHANFFLCITLLYIFLLSTCFGF